MLYDYMRDWVGGAGFQRLPQALPNQNPPLSHRTVNDPEMALQYQADILVIGSGAAGLSLALRLAD
nr:hypothetical protein [Gammaproteobacteria bacterium]